MDEHHEEIVQLQFHVSEILRLLHEDLDSHHLQRTPERLAHTLWDLTHGTQFGFTTFPTNHQHMVVVKDIQFYSLCAHHVLPFFGKAHIGYIPNSKLCGLSKIGRTVKYFSRGLNVQEELTEDIMSFLAEELEPKGVAVVLEGQHLCMQMRGAEQSGMTTTSAMYGVFLDPKRGARQEFLELIKETR